MALFEVQSAPCHLRPSRKQEDEALAFTAREAQVALLFLRFQADFIPNLAKAMRASTSPMSLSRARPKTCNTQDTQNQPQKTAFELFQDMATQITTRMGETSEDIEADRKKIETLLSKLQELQGDNSDINWTNYLNELKDLGVKVDGLIKELDASTDKVLSKERVEALQDAIRTTISAMQECISHVKSPRNQQALTQLQMVERLMLKFLETEHQVILQFIRNLNKGAHG